MEDVRKQVISVEPLRGKRGGVRWRLVLQCGHGRLYNRRRGTNKPPRTAVCFVCNPEGQTWPGFPE